MLQCALSLEAPLAQKLRIAGHQNLIVVQIDSERDGDAAAAVETLLSKGIKSIDVVVAMAAMTTDFKPLIEVKANDIRKVFSINVTAPLLLFQAIRPLLEKGRNPRFLAITSIIGSKALQSSLPWVAGTYGTSKAGLNFVTVRLAIEHPDIISIAVQPGLTETDLATEALRSIGKTMKSSLDEGLAITPKQSADAIRELIDRATKEDSGTYWNAPKRQLIPW